MRPARFQEFALDLIKNSADVTRVQTLAETGDSEHPFGLAITTSSGESRWQIIGQLADGEKHDDPDTPVADGVFQAPWPESAAGDHEGWLATALVRAESPEIKEIVRWSTRPDDATKHGMTVHFHNGAKAFVRKL
ncbi:hypothetical protein ACFXP3_14320 [Streptomyces sp. NPDC059096]|uniref:hypothetical protein n=1 Tax=Streptomyces sp. NPDC059096 TaxID=3346727 RepID=UPI003690EB83